MLFALPDPTIVWPGHDYVGRLSSTIGAERMTNPRIAGKSEAEFIAIMNGLHLRTPVGLAEVVAANLHLGVRQ